MNKQARTKRGPGARARAGVVALAASAGLLAPVATAQASSAISLKESGSLKRVGKAKGFNLNEKGSASGTIKGGISISLKVTGTDKANVSVTVYPKGGSLFGFGATTYHVSGKYAYFTGTLTVKKGKGSWSGAHGSNLKFSGKLNRANDATTVSLSGKLYR